MSGGRIEILVVPDTKGFDSKLASGLKGSSGIASKVGKGIALALAAGTAAAGFGLSAIIAKGRQYEANLNELQAVTQATGVQMRNVGQIAKDLGADMTLPATSAADAAAAMVELAKGGLSVDEAMKAAKGTLQLAAAAQIDGAQAAEIQSNALNAFRLGADQAGRVADVLANTANAAAGSIVDIGNSMKFVAPVSAALGVSIEDTAAAIGLLANQGIKGEQAGTSLRGILASLASPSKLAKKALDELGVSAFNQQGKFIGLRAFTDQLAKAKGRLSEAAFAAASSTAFGNEGFTAANALAAEGATAFDQMATAVSRAGGAADVAGAKTKGLGGAIEGFKSQVETAGIGIFEAIAPQLEKVTRAGGEFVSKFTPQVVSGIQTAVAAGEVFGPRLADALRSRGAVVGSAVKDVLGPLAEAVPGILNAGVNAAIGVWEDFTTVLKNVVDAAKPVARGIADVAKSATQAGGPLSAAGAALGIVGDVAGVLSGVLVPIGKIVGGIASAFADLPGPVQSAVIALGLVAAFRGPLSSLGDTVTNRVTAPFKSMGQEIQLQRALLTGSTDIMSAQVGKFGLAMAALEARVPVMQKMRSSFEEAAAGAERFHRSAGLAAAAGTGLKSAAGGIVSALGGPWGLAIAGATLGLGLLASSQQKAAQKAAEHASWVDGLAQALRQSNGAIDESVRSNVTKRAQDEGALDNAKKLGVAYSDVTTAVLEQGPALDGLRARLQKIVEENTKVAATTGKGSGGVNTFLTEQGKVAKDLLGQLDRLAGGFQSAEEKNRLFDEAMASGKAGMLEATDAGRTFSSAMGVLADKTASADDKARAFKEALDALSGGAIDLESSQARLEERLDRLREGFDEAKFGTKGFVDSLITADGKFNITTDNGRKFRDGLKEITETAAETAQRTFDLTGSVEEASAVIAHARDEVINTGIQMGLSAEQAGILADSMGLVPDDIAILIQTPGMTQAQQELVLVKRKIDEVPPGKSIQMKALTAEAEKLLTDLGLQVVRMPDGSVEIVANTAKAKSDLDSFVANARNLTITIQARLAINTSAVSKEIRLAGLLGAQGHVVEHYASGGLRKLTPMRAGLARIVPPNTWRVVGDRIRDDEAYIPINRSNRSVALLEETAARMGFAIARRYALGGIAGTQSGSVATVASLDGLRITGRLELGTDGFVTLMDGRIHEHDRQVHRGVLAGRGGAR